MASWDSEGELSVDYDLVQNSSVTLFWRTALLDEALDWLREHDYDIADVDASASTSSPDLLKAIGRALQFPDSFGGHSLDAFNDWVGDVVLGEYGWRSDATGLVIVLRSYDSFVTIDPRVAQDVLDIVAFQARMGLLFGNRILCLVQSNDPQIRFGPVGATAVDWNRAEAANVKRQL